MADAPANSTPASLPSGTVEAARLTFPHALAARSRDPVFSTIFLLSVCYYQYSVGAKKQTIGPNPPGPMPPE
jgi:hypothetical protein